MKFGLDLFWPVWLMAAFALTTAAAHIAAYRRTSRPVGSFLRLVLVSVRFLALALIIFVLWRPAAESEVTLSRRSRLALLVDTSRSMSIGDEEVGSSPASRITRALSVFSDNRDLWKKIAEVYDVSGYTFSRGLAPIGGDILDRPLALSKADGPVTAIGDALREASRAVNAPEALLIVSDGLNNAGIDPMDAAQPGGAPIYAVSVGKAEAAETTRDVSVAGIFAQPQAFVGSEVPVVANLSLVGLADRTVKATFRVDGKDVESKDITATRGQATQEARFSFKPDKVGPARVEVRVEPLPDEIVVSNNFAPTYVDVKAGRMKVLYVEGAFRWEAKFTRLAIESAKDVDLRLLMPKGPDDDVASKAVGEDWDVLIMGDVPASSMPPIAVQSIVDAVNQKGKGVLFLGGNSAYGSGGYAGSPLASLMPFEISGSDKIDRGSYVLSPKPLGPNTGIISVGAAGAADVWRTLAPLMSLNLVGAPKPGASVLLEGVPVTRDPSTGVIAADASRKNAPVLGVEEYGKGRTAALTGEGTWQWVTGAGLTETAARDAAADAHRRFWRQLVFWLARREDSGDIIVNLSLSRHRVDLGDKVEMEADVLDKSLKAVTDASLTADVTSQGKTVTRRFWLEGDRYKVDFEPPGPGDYDVKVSALRDGKKVAERASAFVVAGADIEFATLLARPSLLESLSRVTGARYSTASGAAEVLGDVIKRGTSTRYVKLERREIWSSYWYIALIVLLLSLEWGLRKSAGLV